MKNKSGFTIVELLIVIVVIAILAAIIIVAFNGVTQKANDSKRLSDIDTIVKALEVYKMKNGDYPAAQSTPNASSWETSTNGTTVTDFISALRTGNAIATVPVDPGSPVVSGTLNPGSNSSAYEFFYYRYSAGANGCPTNLGDYYVLGINRMDTVTWGQKASQNPGLQCGYVPANVPWLTQGFQYS